MSTKAPARTTRLNNTIMRYEAQILKLEKRPQSMGESIYLKDLRIAMLREFIKDLKFIRGETP